MPGFPFGTLDGYLSLCDNGDAEKQRWQSGALFGFEDTAD